MATRKTTLAIALSGLSLAALLGWWWQRPQSRVSPADTVPAVAAARPGASAAGGAGGAGARPGGPAGNRPASVEVAAVRTMALRDEAEAVGSLRSRQSVVVRPEVAGRVTQLNFRDGERVRKGQVLLQLDDQLPRAQVQQAQAELSIAQANHKRNQELVAQGFISQRSVDESAANLEVAQAKLALAQATAARLRIVAPFDGVAGIRNINVGDYLKDGTDIVNIEDIEAMYVDFRLPERLQTRVARGQTARVTFDALPGARYDATVLAINPQIDADGRSVAVRACIDNRRLELRPGMFARVTAVFGERSNALVVPEEAVVPDAKQPFVWRVAEGSEPGSRVARKVPVVLGARVPGSVEVLQGLQLGQQVVTAGQQRLNRDGAPVRVVELGQTSGGAGMEAAPGRRPAPSASSPAAPADAASAPRADAGTAQPPAAPAAPAALRVADSGRAVAAPLGANPCRLPLTAARSAL